MMKLTEPLFTVFNQEISGRDIILLVGGLFLVAKSTHEIHHAMQPGFTENGKEIEKEKVKFC